MVVKPDGRRLWGCRAADTDYQPGVAAEYPQLCGARVAGDGGADGRGRWRRAGLQSAMSASERKEVGRGRERTSRREFANDKRMIARGKGGCARPRSTPSWSSAAAPHHRCFCARRGGLAPRQLVLGNTIYSRSPIPRCDHPALVTLYKAGIFFAIFGVIYGAFERYTRTAYEHAARAVAETRMEHEKIALWVVLYSGSAA